MVLASAAGTQLTSLDRQPGCPEHAVSKVTRQGVYGRGATKRQRYRCVPADGTAPHTFTPPLAREAVEGGVESCTTCDELLSPHRGALTGARHTPWTLALYARALNELSMGASYAAVSLMMREYRDRASRHLLEHHGGGALLDESFDYLPSAEGVEALTALITANYSAPAAAFTAASAALLASFAFANAAITAA